MTNLDVLCKVLSEVTHRPEHRFRRAICAAIEAGAIPTGKLLNECPNGDDLVRRLVQNEASGILKWAVKGGVLAAATTPF